MGDDACQDTASVLPKAAIQKSTAEARQAKTPSEGEATLKVINGIERMEETKQHRRNEQAEAELNSSQMERTAERLVDPRLNVSQTVNKIITSHGVKFK